MPGLCENRLHGDNVFYCHTSIATQDIACIIIIRLRGNRLRARQLAQALDRRHALHR